MGTLTVYTVATDFDSACVNSGYKDYWATLREAEIELLSYDSKILKIFEITIKEIES